MKDLISCIATTFILNVLKISMKKNLNFSKKICPHEAGITPLCDLHVYVTLVTRTFLLCGLCIRNSSCILPSTFSYILVKRRDRKLFNTSFKIEANSVSIDCQPRPQSSLGFLHSVPM